MDENQRPIVNLSATCSCKISELLYYFSTRGQSSLGEQTFATMASQKDNRHHDWKKAQPHDAKTGKIRTEKFAREHPDKVEWVTSKKPKN